MMKHSISPSSRSNNEFLFCTTQDKVSSPCPAITAGLWEETEEKGLPCAKELGPVPLKQLACNEGTKHLEWESQYSNVGQTYKGLTSL